MGKVVCDIAVSLDGFVTGPDDRVGNPLGDNGELLHEWVFDAGTDVDHDVFAERFKTSGAVVVGRRMFDVGFEPWGDPPPYEGLPVFVVTHEARDPIPMQGGTTYVFVSTGIEDAIAQAKEAAGGKDVGLFGGAAIFQACFRAGLVDQMLIHVVPVLLHRGVRLFERLDGAPIKLEKTRAVETPHATHLWLAVPR
jgi:dihydrofolate reductase